MKKNLKRDILINIFFILTFTIIYLILTKDGHLFASNVDFKYQHYLIPEYLRTMFYNTHDLLPDFALNLGGGQNIYYLSYYGLLNPIILISYLFPKIKMIDYLITSNCLIVLISTSLFYFYLRKNKYNLKTCIVSSFLFLCSGPLIFHAKRHIMFINYFPFLLLGFYGIDDYIKKKKRSLLVLSITLIIFTSYYFSVSSLIVLYLLGIYKYLKYNKHSTKKGIINYCLKLTYPFIIGIMISAIITLPTFYTLLNGRNATATSISLKELLTPSITSSLLYSAYSIGLPLISLIAIIYLVIKGKKETRFLSITCFLILTFPIFNYILNGTLYINAKSLIPFLPIILILVADFLNPYLKKKINSKQVILIAYLIITSFSICLFTNRQDKLMTKEEINNSTYKTAEELINQITKEDQSFYRINNSILKELGINKVTNIKEYKTTLYSSTYNKEYVTLYNNILNNPLPNRNKFMIFPSNNIISQILLNEKYILTDSTLGLDYELIKEKKGVKLYKNNNTLPLGYASNHLLNLQDYNKLTYPNNALTLLNYIVINDKNIPSQSIYQTSQTKINYEILEQNNIELLPKNHTITIHSQKDGYMTIKINQDMTNKILLLRFHNSNNPNKDLAITINNVTNKLTSKDWKYHNNNLTFDYYLYDTNILTITFQKGTYQLDNFETYLLDYEQIKNKNQEIDPFQVDNLTKGDIISGTINVTKDNSYFTISIPYDKGFQILIDNEETKYEKTGANFIAFPITKGKHNIKITYNAPYKKISLLISIIGIIILTSQTIIDIRKKYT